MSSPVQDNPENYAFFRDCLSTALLKPDPAETAPPKRRRRGAAAKADVGPAADDPEETEESEQSEQLVAEEGGKEDEREAEQEEDDDDDLADFVDYLATELFECLPPALQSLDHNVWRDSPDLRDTFSVPVSKHALTSLNPSPSLIETLETYNLISPSSLSSSSSSSLPSSLESFLAPILTTYIPPLSSPPPHTKSSRASACELCLRPWIPLSYHHLIPRFVHAKAVKRGWHRREDLQNVAWLCGACHSFVHRFRGHEDLARRYYTVELLLEEDEVRRWAEWVGRLRWKGGKTRKRR